MSDKTTHAEWFVSDQCRKDEHTGCAARSCACYCHHHPEQVPEQRESEARPKESPSCPAWEDGQHCYTVGALYSNEGVDGQGIKSCACGKTIGRSKPADPGEPTT